MSYTYTYRHPLRPIWLLGASIVVRAVVFDSEVSEGYALGSVLQCLPLRIRRAGGSAGRSFSSVRGSSRPRT